MKKIVILFSISILLVAFVNRTDKKHDKQMTADFSFRITGETDNYDSNTGIYTRKYLMKDSSVKVYLTREELNNLFVLFEECDFMSFPQEFECAKNGTFTLPAFSTTIEIIYKGLYKKVTNTDRCDRKIEQQKSDKFDEFSSEIRKMINKKPEIENMRKSDLFFL